MKKRKLPQKIPYSHMLYDYDTVNLTEDIPSTLQSISTFHVPGERKCSEASNHLSNPHLQSEHNITKRQFEKYAETLSKLQTKQQSLTCRKMESSNKKKKCQDQYLNERIRIICNSFINKLQRNNIFTSVFITETDLEHFYKREFLRGVEVKPNVMLAHQIILTISIFSLIISQSFVFAFDELKGSIDIQAILMLSTLAFLLEIISNSVVVKRVEGTFIKNLKDIFTFYVKSKYLFIDCSILIIIVFNLLMPILLFGLLFEVDKLASKLNKLEQNMVKNYYYEKYVSLLKIMIFNFLFAHAIAILLNQIALNNFGHSWQTVKGLDHSAWQERYIWSYYWATTMMLTVGFGDIVPTNSNEALCVVFIEFVSCIAFSYNISCFGTLIGNIKSQIEETEKNRKIFEGMDKKIGFSGDLFSKIEHYINQSAYIRSKFNISEEKAFIENLPAGYRKEVTCETNKKLLKSLPFFSCLLDKTIYKIAQHMERHIYYPEETIKTISSNFAIYVLEHGKVGYICKKFGSKYNNVVANEVRVKQNSHPFVLAQEFITFRKLNYEIKSLGYSVIHHLSYQNFLEEVHKMKKDYEYYRYLRDKSKHIIDQYETVDCAICKAKHTCFDCPKYHYLPIHEHVKRRYLHQEKQGVNLRYESFSRDARRRRAFTYFKNHQFFTKDFTDSQACYAMRIKLTEKQEQMKRFVVNFYNFYESSPDKKEEEEQDIYESGTIKTLKNLGLLNDIDLSPVIHFWDIECDTGFDYDIYFPEDNPLQLRRKYNYERRIIKALNESRLKKLKMRNHQKGRGKGIEVKMVVNELL